MKARTKDLPHSKGIYFKYDLLNSKAWRALTRTQVEVLIAFYLKRQFPGEKKSKKTGVEKDTILNNGKIIFTYSEAEDYGICKAAFTRALDKLIGVGFVDISLPSALHKQSTLYAISDRWRDYGTKNFRKVERVKTENGVGTQTRFKPKAQQNSPAIM